jgi:NAD(P)-dependent dehydrogenase (short-subunit alcohol dehydrogenase family)
MTQHAPGPSGTGHTVILGGTAGIGLAAAARLAAGGHAVTVAGRDPGRLERALERLRADAADPKAVHGRTADLASRADLDALFGAVGPVDHLVIAAPGTGAPGALAELDLPALAAAFESKFVSCARAIQAALPTLARHGSITLVSAASAQCAMPGTAGLAAVNGAVETLVPTLALELAPIRVNAVSPGVVDTDWWDRVAPAEHRQAVFASLVPSIPLGRVADPDEIAQVIALLVDNAYMTGTVIPVDGGARLKPAPAAAG